MKSFNKWLENQGYSPYNDPEHVWHGDSVMEPPTSQEKRNTARRNHRHSQAFDKTNIWGGGNSDSTLMNSNLEMRIKNLEQRLAALEKAR